MIQILLDGAPGRIRTSGLLIRSQSLYPAELRAHTMFQFGTKDRLSGFGDGCNRHESGYQRWLRGWLRRNQREFCVNVEARLTHKLGD
jgi:hypothetical protein